MIILSAALREDLPMRPGENSTMLVPLRISFMISFISFSVCEILVGHQSAVFERVHHFEHAPEQRISERNVIG